jgi:ribosomal protein S18 acetylase RimI-like enzyme
MSNIRRIAEQDREAVRILLEGTEAFKAHEVDVAMELVDIALAQPSEDDYRPFVLVEEDGTVAAYACFGKNEMTAATYDLYWVATRADRMGRGHGRRIVAFVEEEIRKEGGRLLVIETSSKESYGETRAFYEKIGCTLAAQLPDYYDEGDDKLIYLKSLA